MSQKNIVFLFNNLRVSDNPALYHSIKDGDTSVIYNYGNQNIGAASKVWLHHSLIEFKKQLNHALNIQNDCSEELLNNLIKKDKIKSIYLNRSITPDQAYEMKKIIEFGKNNEIPVYCYESESLWHPDEIHKNDGTPYKVFTPFYRKGCLPHSVPRKPYPTPNLNISTLNIRSLNIEDLNLLPSIRWDKQLVDLWDISEEGAHKQLNEFIEVGLTNYKEGRNFPAKPYISKLSPYLHFGQLSINELWHIILNQEDSKSKDHFLSELGWREFSIYLLHHFKNLQTENFQKKFDKFPWKYDEKTLQNWQKGQTGIPIVDAGMRELYTTGFMHNRSRMIVGSFLVKNLLIDWRHGERWFWDCLFDADHASNSASWQWVAGSGADAAPYFRIFNPVTQAAKFDPDGEYIKKYVPELKKCPLKYLFAPWEAPDHELRAFGIILGETYPKPIVDLKKSRESALEAFQLLKQT